MTDFTFAPPGIAPLSFIGGYQDLSESQQLRYEQLFGLYLNEQTAFFEEQVGDSVLPPLITNPALPSALHQGLREFLEDEKRHSQMFRQLNSALDPGLYPLGWRGYRFVKPPPGALRLLRFSATRAAAFLFWLWIMLIQEECSLHFGRCVLRNESALDPRVVAAHQIHLADEAAHVAWDIDLIDILWARSSPAKRAINARLLRLVVGNFFVSPRRANLEVVRQLVVEFPELFPHLPLWEQDMAALGRDPRYQRTIYGSDVLRRTFTRFRQFPELHQMAMVFPEFQPQAEMAS